jgi:peptidoglycan/xylan/chitin deacetylase (PgdA/CDA1 family)
LITTVAPLLPKGKRFAVALTFDFDSITIYLGAFKQKTPTAISRGEFGNVGAQRIADTLAHYRINGTFFTPAYTIETYEDTVKELVRKGHEIGHHNYLHETPIGMDLKTEREIMDKSNSIIERVVGKKARGYRSPAWDLSDNTLDLLLERGFLYDSSMMAHDYLPYKIRKGDIPTEEGPFKFGKSTNMIEIPVSWSLDDFPVFEYVPGAPGSGLRDARGVLHNWISDFNYMTEHFEVGVYNICMHPSIIGRGHRIKTLEALIDYIIKRDDTVFMKMEEIAKSCAKSNIVKNV